MIETIKPPTDNLYKFLAIFCLGIFLASITAPFLYENKVTEQQLELLRDASIHVTNAQDWKQAGDEMRRASARSDEEFKRLNEAVDKRLKGQLSASEVQLAFEKEAKARSDLRESIRVLRDGVAKWEKETADVEFKRNLLENRKDNARVMRGVCVLGAIVSLLLSSIGFRLWYKRSQRYYDIVARKRAENGPKAD